MRGLRRDHGRSTQKKVAAGAALGVAIPAAVTVAKKAMKDESTADRARRKAAEGASGMLDRAERLQATARRAASARRPWSGRLG